MNRRRILKRIGAVSAATIAVGTVSASEGDDGPEMRVYLPDQDDTVTIQDDCFCSGGCLGCDCPSHCDACIC